MIAFLFVIVWATCVISIERRLQERARIRRKKERDGAY